MPALAKQSFTRSMASASVSGVAEERGGKRSGDSAFSWLSSTGMISAWPLPWQLYPVRS